MSRLDELIAEYCPDGVEYKNLSDIATITRGGSLQKKDFSENGVPCIHYGQIYTRFGLFTDHALTFVSEEVAQRQKKAKHGDIIMAVTSENIEDVCKCVVWLGKTDAAVSGHTAIISSSQNSKYLAYYFHSSMFFSQKKKLAHGTKVIEVTPDKLNDVTIPVPPLPVQHEIVRILDVYSKCIAELQESLSAELTARKKQYEYFKDILFDGDWEAAPIAEIADTNIGLATSVTKHKRDNGVILIHNSDIQPNAIVLKAKEFISTEFAQKNKGKLLQKNDIITVHTGDVGTSAVIDEQFEGAIGFTTITTRIKDANRIIPHYLCHYLNTHKCKTDIATMTISDRSNLNQKSYEKLMIPIPPIEEQQRIICILDQFDSLRNYISSGLPAEIDARQKQYEYYRDKLLAFREKDA